MDHDRGGAMPLLAAGLLAGAAGVAAMTLGEKLEQAVTGRPNSFVPGHTLERLLGRPARPDRERQGLNWAMHWGQGILLGMVRAVMARGGVGGPFGSFLFLNLRLLNDQSLENATGIGAPPWTWPRDEQVVDLLHKAVYAFATGAVADRLVTGRASPGTGLAEPEGWHRADHAARSAALRRAA
ncbi:hypothetical protein [Belnapia moabensis]|uniref:hypothetical protein n=1 Tax=Belnapia moabensis TaxID=365533 RepID=UPI001B80E171|nr:hypothetical protein [Belnapia moabensis]